ncbi:MAG: transposase [Bacteroidales bacterium]
MNASNTNYHRHSIRLPGYDYSQEGAYYITICTYNRKNLFGEIKNNEMILNEHGKIANEYWEAIPKHYPNTQLDEYVIMPNHVHGILIVGAYNYTPLQRNEKNIFRSPSKTIGAIVRGYKIGVTKYFRKNTDIFNVWQRNYYEHIIRDTDDLSRILVILWTIQRIGTMMNII